jgi:hypothetical protein
MRASLIGERGRLSAEVLVGEHRARRASADQ